MVWLIIQLDILDETTTKTPHSKLLKDEWVRCNKNQTVKILKNAHINVKSFMGNFFFFILIAKENLKGKINRYKCMQIEDFFKLNNDITKSKSQIKNTESKY